MFDFLAELRHAIRFLIRKPTLTLVAIVSLGLGLGVNGAIFTLVDAALFQDVVATDPEELVEIYLSSSDDFAYSTLSYPDYLDINGSEVFAGVLGQRATLAAWDNGQDVEMLFGQEISGNYFQVLGVQPILGRGFRPEEADTPGGEPVAVLGHRFWQQRFASNPDVLGRNLELSGVDFTIIGVAPEQLRGDLRVITSDFFVPLTMHDALAERASLMERGTRSLMLRGRLAEGVSLEQAGSEMERLGTLLAAEYPDTNEGRRITVVPSQEVAINPGFDGPIKGVAGSMMALVGLVLLIACSNIANVLLVRASDRRREIAVRLALGSGRGRLMRRFLTESLLLALAGGILGLALSKAMVTLIVAFEPPMAIPISLDLEAGATVSLYVLGLSLVTGLLCGLAPAIQATRPSLVPALKDDDGNGALFRRFGLRNVLVVAQVAVSTLLLVGAGLFLRSLGQANSIETGFALDRGVAVQTMLGMGGAYSEEEGKIFQRRLREEIEALPGVRSAAWVGYLPLSLQISNRSYLPEGTEVPDGERGPKAMVTEAGIGYFATMGVDLVAGRSFDGRDTSESPPVVIVNETLARRHWPGESPLGKRLRWSEDSPWMEVVGVAADGKYATLGEEPRSFVYSALAQEYESGATLVVASDGNEAALLTQVRSVIDRLDPDVAIFEQRLLSEHLAAVLFPARLGAALLASFGILGLLLASMGLYGVVAHTVAQRTREVGIRVAIGAGRGDILKLISRGSLGLVSVGLVLGLALASLAGRAFASLLYGVTPLDLVTFVAVPVILLLVASVANLGPALRALGIEPSEALRYE